MRTHTTFFALLVSLFIIIISSTTQTTAVAVHTSIEIPQDRSTYVNTLNANPLNDSILGHAGGVTNAIEVQGTYAYTHFGSEFVVLNVTNPAEMLPIGNLLLPNVVTDISIQNNFAFVSTTDSLHKIDVTDPHNPTQLYFTPQATKQIIVEDDFLYLIDENRLLILDVNDLTIVGSYIYTGREILAIAKEGSMIYLSVATSWTGGLQLVDISDPTNPIPSGYLPIEEAANSLAVENNFVYWAKGTVYIIDASNPNNLTIVSEQYFDVEEIQASQIYGEQLYLVSADDGLVILNISDPENLFVDGIYRTQGFTSDLSREGNTIYLSDTGTGIIAIDVTDVAAPRLVSLYQMPEVHHDIVESGPYTYFAAGEQGLRIIDVSNKENPINVGLFSLPDMTYQLAIKENYLYANTVKSDNTSRLRVIDISDKVNPHLITSLDIPGRTTKIVIKDSFLFLTWNLANASGFLIADISNPASPEILASVDLTVQESGYAESIDVIDNYAYVAFSDYYGLGNGEGLSIYDITIPTDPVFVKDIGPSVYEVVIDGNIAYLSQRDRVVAFDITDPENPIEIGNVFEDYMIGMEMIIKNNFAFLVSYFHLFVVDISDPIHPQIRFVTRLPNSDTEGPSSIYPAGDGGYVYLSKSDLLQTIDIATFRWPVELGLYETFGYTYGITSKGNYLYVNTGPNLLYNFNGLRTVDITVPGSPTQVGVTENPPVYDWNAYEVDIEGNYAYLAANLAGLQIVDISNPLTLKYASGIGIPGGRSVGVDVKENYAYVAASYGDLHIIDVSNPLTLQQAAHFYSPNNVEDVIVIDNFAYLAEEYVDDSGAYENQPPQGMRILDISDPLNPTSVDMYELPPSRPTAQDGGAKKVVIANDCAYIFKAGGIDFVDISDPNNLVKTGEWASPVRNMRVVDQEAYLITDYYVYVLNVSNPCNPIVKGAYPFPGNNLIVSDVTSEGNSLFFAAGTAGLFEYEKIEFEYMYLPVAHLSIP